MTSPWGDFVTVADSLTVCPEARSVDSVNGKYCPDCGWHLGHAIACPRLQ